MAEIPVSLSTGYDPSLEYAFRTDTQARLDRIFSNVGAPTAQLPQIPKRDYTYTIPDILKQDYKVNNDFNLSDAYFSPDNKTRQLAQEVIDRNIAKDFEFLNRVNVPTIYPYEEGAGKFLGKDFGFRPEEGVAGNEDFYYRNEYLAQPWYERGAKNLGKFVGRTIGGAVLKLGQSVGYVGSMINPANWDSDFMTHVADNAFSRFMEDSETHFKNRDWWDVYHGLDYNKKGLFSKMGDATWWNDSFSDGVSFLLSAAVPGVGLGKLGQGIAFAGKGARISRMLTGADHIGGIGAWAVNTASESAFEAAQVFKNYRDSLIADRVAGKNNLTDEQIQDQAGHMASNSFKGNLMVLALPNAFTNNMVFQKIAKTTKSPITPISITGDLRAAGVKLPKTRIAKEIAATGRMPFYGVKGAQALGAEGLWEENAQLAIQRMNEGHTEKAFIAQYFDQLTDVFAGKDPEAAEAIALGGLIGLLGTGVGSKFTKIEGTTFRGERRAKVAEQEKRAKTADKINEARKSWLSLDGIYETDENDKVVFENGEPKVDEVKLATKMAGMKAVANTMEVIDNVKDEDLKDFLSKDLFKEFVKANIEGGTFERFLSRLDDLSMATPEEIRGFGFDPEAVKYTPAELKDYAERLGAAYVQTHAQFVNSNTGTILKDDQAAAEEVYRRQGQNIALGDYKHKVNQRFIASQGQIRDMNTASLSDLFAEEYNQLSFKEEALKQQADANPDNPYYKDKIKDIQARKKELIDGNPDTTDLKHTSDDFYFNEKQITRPGYFDYLNNQRRISEIENIIDENDHVSARLIIPSTRLEQQAQLAGKRAEAIPAVIQQAKATPGPVAQKNKFVSSEDYIEFTETGKVSDNTINLISDKVAKGATLTQQEEAIAAAKADLIAPKVEAARAKAPAVSPGVKNKTAAWKGAVAYLTPLKTITQEVEIKGMEEIVTVTPYQDWIQTFLNGKLQEYLAKGYKIFLMKDKAEWTFNKSSTWDNNLGIVLAIAKPDGSIAYFNKKYEEVEDFIDGQPIVYSIDVNYMDHGDIETKVSTATEKGMIVNGVPDVKFALNGETRKMYTIINDDLQARRARLLKDEAEPMEVVFTSLQANNTVPQGKIRNAQEVFGEDPAISFNEKGEPVMEVDNIKHVVKTAEMKDIPELPNDLASLYSHTYANKADAERALKFIMSVLPSDVFRDGEVREAQSRPGFKLNVKYAGKDANDLQFSDLVKGNMKRKVFFSVDPKLMTAPGFEEAYINDKKEVVFEDSDYYTFVKDKFTTTLKGTRTSDGGVSYRPMNSYFTFEFAENIGKPSPIAPKAPEAPKAPPVVTTATVLKEDAAKKAARERKTKIAEIREERTAEVSAIDIPTEEGEARDSALAQIRTINDKYNAQEAAVLGTTAAPSITVAAVSPQSKESTRGFIQRTIAELQAMRRRELIDVSMAFPELNLVTDASVLKKKIVETVQNSKGETIDRDTSVGAAQTTIKNKRKGLMDILKCFHG